MSDSKKDNTIEKGTPHVVVDVKTDPAPALKVPAAQVNERPNPGHDQTAPAPAQK